MRRAAWTLPILMLIFACLALVFACGDDDDDDDTSAGDDDDDDDDAATDDDDDDSAGPSVLDVSHGDCKNLKNGLPDWPESLAFDFQSGVLTVHHVNGVFNCCIERIDVDVSLQGATLSLYEQQYAPQPCDCICPYDVDTDISGLADATYTVDVYVNGSLAISGQVAIP